MIKRKNAESASDIADWRKVRPVLAAPEKIQTEQYKASITVC